MPDIRVVDFGSNEAKYDDLERYFYDTGAVQRVLSGDVHLIVGRKGSGKTAIATYIEKSSAKTWDQFSHSMSAGEIPLGLIDKFQDSRFTGSAKYVPVWRYIILLEISKILLRDESISNDNATKLKAFLELNFPDLHNKTIDYLSSTLETGLKLKIKIIEASTSKKTETKYEEVDLISYLDSLENCIKTTATLGNKYILFLDELDHIYEGRPVDYNDILVGLLKAIDHINSSCRREHKVVRATALIRDDIYKTLRYSDRNKVKDFRIDIDWSIGHKPLIETDLFKMINCRIGASVDCEVQHGKNYWNMVISQDKILGNISPFSYILSRSFLRPRDIIEFCKCIQRQCRADKLSVANRLSFTKSEQEYSDWFRDELVDEVNLAIPEIDSVLEAIRDHGRGSFYAKDINRYFQRANIQSSMSVNTILAILFDFSAIGVFQEDSDRVPVFKYRDPTKRFRPRKKCSIHYGLRHNLELT